jgi:hypothetical protein
VTQLASAQLVIDLIELIYLHIPPQPTDQDRDINRERQHYHAGDNQRQQRIDNLHPSGRG